ncbi:MAG: hypothetical protein WAW41_03705, partial [Methylobacter sp.]
PHGLISTKAPVLGAANGIESAPSASFHCYLVPWFKGTFVSYGLSSTNMRNTVRAVTSVNNCPANLSAKSTK